LKCTLCYRNLEQYQKAIATANKALKMDSNYAPGYYTRALAYQYLKQYKLAYADLLKAQELGVGVKASLIEEVKKYILPVKKQTIFQT